VHSLERARESGLFRHLAVSSDSDEILDVARRWGCEILVRRPAELASDHAPKLPAIRHCVVSAEADAGGLFDVIVDLDATSPLRTADDIRNTVRLLEESGAGNVITGTPARRSPYFNLVELDGAGIARLCKAPPGKAIVRRQDAPACFDMNASVYAWRREVLFSSDSVFNADTRLYVMPEERSIDIDSELDFQFVEFLMLGKARAAP
jgi:N-acylneuraminate cytidylyltransferase/CMP-N,N'-diacetyllegionaminic acid synthase